MKLTIFDEIAAVCFKCLVDADTQDAGRRNHEAARENSVCCVERLLRCWFEQLQELNQCHILHCR